MPFDLKLESLKEAAGVFQFGSGVMGKSAIVVSVMEVGMFSVAATLHSDWMKLGAVVLGAGVFMVWYLRLISFADKNPDTAVLEGAVWVEHQRLQASAKGFVPSPADLALTDNKQDGSALVQNQKVQQEPPHGQ